MIVGEPVDTWSRMAALRSVSKLIIIPSALPPIDLMAQGVVCFFPLFVEVQTCSSQGPPLALKSPLVWTGSPPAFSSSPNPSPPQIPSFSLVLLFCSAIAPPPSFSSIALPPCPAVHFLASSLHPLPFSSLHSSPILLLLLLPLYSPGADSAAAAVGGVLPASLFPRKILSLSEIVFFCLCSRLNVIVKVFSHLGGRPQLRVPRYASL